MRWTNGYGVAANYQPTVGEQAELELGRCMWQAVQQATRSVTISRSAHHRLDDRVAEIAMRVGLDEVQEPRERPSS